MASEDWKTLLDVVGALTAIGGVVWGVLTYRRTNEITHYAEIDRTYMDLLKMRMDDPNLTPKPGVAPESPKYDAYAFMIWNFLETIYDRSDHYPSLKETWSPIVKYEADLHKAWFTTGNNQDRFKQRFRDFARPFLA